MGLKATRRILCTILALVISVCTLLTIGSVAFKFTVGSQPVVTKQLINGDAISEAERQLEEKFEALEIKSGIPKRVFLMVNDNTSVEDAMDTAMQNVFGEENADMYSNNRVEYFYNLCTEYLDGNGIPYTEENVRLVADEAAHIYSDCVGIHGKLYVVGHITEVSSVCLKLAYSAIAMIVLSLMLMCVLFKTRENAYLYTLAGVSGGSLAALFGALACLIARVGMDISVQPAVYTNGANGIVRLCYVAIMASGVMIFAATTVVMFVIYAKKNQETLRKDVRFAKIISKL